MIKAVFLKKKRNLVREKVAFRLLFFCCLFELIVIFILAGKTFTVFTECGNPG